ncbi:MAG: galactose oxidase-like domain-containing protein [Actinomycetota bacterium]
MRAKLRLTSALVALGTMASLLSAAGTARAAAPACAADGCWTAPFSPFGKFDAAPPQTVEDSEKYPAAASSVMLPNGRVLYWNGLQNLEGCGQLPVPANAGACTGNATSETLDLTGSSPVFTSVPVTPGNHDDLFCSDQRLLENGTVLDTGGTNWVTEEPAGGTGVPGADGLAELYGNKNSRIYNPTPGNPALNEGWTSSVSAPPGSVAHPMNDGRWYPSLLTLPNGNSFVAGGVTKLLWNSSIMTQVEDAIGNKQYEQATAPVPENVQTTETRNLVTGQWTRNPPKDDVELPLFARLHLLPDGEIFYSGAGQMWGPAGESVNELDWNNMKLFDPSKMGTSDDQGWRNVGMLSLGAMSGSASVLMPLDASKQNGLDTVHVLVAGGAIGVSPDTYLGTTISQMVTLQKSGSTYTPSVARTGDLNNRRWFSSSVLLPNGQVLLFNGADKDEVVLPGSEVPVHQAELFDPATNSWRGLSSSARDRTYHNSAILLPDGSVLVGGHAPINQGYGGTGNALPLDQLGFAHNLKDPSFERFYPPYLFDKNGWAPRPVILSAQAHTTYDDGTLEVQIAPHSAPIDHFVLTRLPAQTHITDADARTVILGAGEPNGSSVKLHIPNEKAAITPGFYYLFAVSPQGVPSVAPIVQIATDTKYFVGASSATPVQLMDQTGSFRSQAISVTHVSPPASGAKAASARAATKPATTDTILPVSAPEAPVRGTQSWVIVLAVMMGTVLVRRIWTVLRRT